MSDAYARQLCVEAGKLELPQPGQARICYRQTGSGYGEVARIDADGRVTIFQPAYLDHLHPSDMVALLQAIAPSFAPKS